MVSLHAKDLHEQGQGQAGQHEGEEEYGEHHDDGVLAYLFGAVDHGDGQGKNQGHEATHTGPGHDDNFGEAFGGALVDGGLASCQPDDGEPDEAHQDCDHCD